MQFFMKRWQAIVFVTYWVLIVGSVAVAALVVLTGCSAEITVKNPGIWECTDFRDGEVWRYDNTDPANIRNATMNPFTGTASFVIIDTSGIEHHVTAPLPDWLKCEMMEGTTEG